MPFTFAHPAAVLPLKRCCRSWLSFPALIIGSVSPDLAYLVPNGRIDSVAHEWTGLFLFSLPAGAATVWLLHRLGRLVVPALPNPFRRVLLPAVEQPLGSVFAVICSVVIGAATHIFWDSFTHKEGWAVRHIAILNQPLGLAVEPRARVCHLLWYLSTIAGIACLAFAYQSWRGKANNKPALPSTASKWTNAVLLATVMAAAALIHHLRHGVVIPVVISLLLVTGFIVWVEKQTVGPSDCPAGPPR